LTEEERTEVKARLKLDRTSLADEYHSKFFYDALKDWKIYVHMLITIGMFFSHPIEERLTDKLSQASTHLFTRSRCSSPPL